MAICDATFNELKVKDVINICDCKKLGRVSDIVIDLRTGKVRGIVLPGSRGFNIFKQPEDIFIPWKNILRIGNDVILVEIFHRLRGCKDKSGDGKCGEEKDCDGDGVPDELFDTALRPRVLKYLRDDDNCGSDDDN